MPSCSTPRSPTARCAGPRPTCGCASTARSKRACNRSIAWCWAAWSRASGRRRRAAIPGSAGRCATSSASICRSGASACRRTISPQALGAPEVILTPRGEARRRADGRLALRAAARRGRGRGALERSARARRALRGAGPQARRDRQRPARCAQARAPAAARGAAAPAQRHRDRGSGCAIPTRSTPSTCSSLQPLDAIDTPPGAADRGTLIHDSIGEFAKAFPDKLPDDPVAVLKDIGARHFQPLADFPEARAFWWPRFLRIAEWLARFRDRGGAHKPQALRCRDRRQHRNSVRQRGRSSSPCGPTASNCLNDGRYAMLDYKTGAPPSDKQVLSGLSPQLTLEAAILRQGGFKDIPAGRNSGASWSMCGCAAAPWPARRSRSSSRTGTPDEHADRALAKLTAVARQVRRSGEPLLLAAASDVDDALRHLRPSRARAGVVADRRYQRRRSVRMSKPRDIPAAVTERQTTASDPGRSAWVAANAGSGKTHVLAQRVIRLLLVGRRSGAHPLHHLHQGRRRQHGEPRVQRSAVMDRAGRRRARRRHAQGRRAAHRRQAAAARAPAFRAGAGDAGRIEGAHHPRLLHAAPAPVPVRGQCRGAFRGARRDQGKPASRTAQPRRDAQGRRTSRTARSAARWPRPCSPPPT